MLQNNYIVGVERDKDKMYQAIEDNNNNVHTHTQTQMTAAKTQGKMLEHGFEERG